MIADQENTKSGIHRGNANGMVAIWIPHPLRGIRDFRKKLMIADQENTKSGIHRGNAERTRSLFIGEAKACHGLNTDDTDLGSREIPAMIGKQEFKL